MKIRGMELTEAARLTDFYNERFAGQPFYYRVTPEEFEDGVRFQYWKDKPHPQLSDQRLFVAEDAGGIVGFSHVARRQWAEGSFGTIRFFDFRPDSRGAGDALLRESEGYLRELGLSEVWACGGPRSVSYRFHRVAWGASFTNLMAHVRGLFGVHGYRINRDGDDQRTSRSFMVLPLDDVEEPLQRDKGIELNSWFWTHNAQRRNVKVHLVRDGREVGVVDSWSMGEGVRDPSARDICYSGDLSLDEEERGSGLGRFLVQYAHWMLRREGYRVATLHTGVDNHRTHLLFASIGYRVVDTTLTFVKRFGGRSGWREADPMS